MTTFISIIGFLAGTLTTIAFIPQVLKAWKSRSTKDISLLMFSILTTGVFLWLVYGLLKTDYPVIIANFVTFILASTILALKLKYK